MCKEKKIPTIPRVMGELQEGGTLGLFLDRYTGVYRETGGSIPGTGTTMASRVLNLNMRTMEGNEASEVKEPRLRRSYLLSIGQRAREGKRLIDTQKEGKSLNCSAMPTGLSHAHFKGLRVDRLAR
jgi:hypothetical protein